LTKEYSRCKFSFNYKISLTEQFSRGLAIMMPDSVHFWLTLDFFMCWRL